MALIIGYLTVLLCTTGCSSSNNSEEAITPTVNVSENENESESESESEATQLTYPNISQFKTTPSDQFLVDINDVVDGHMYKGAHSTAPHSGAHVIFDVPSSDSITDNADYPNIYAIAAGTVSKIDTYFKVNHPQTPHYRYGIDITFASNEENTIRFHYSIEPFIDPGDPNFYTPFILVSLNQTVQKGDVIAKMYLSDSEYAHIHFNLFKVKPSGSSTFQVPAIFTTEIMSQFENKISPANGGNRNFDTTHFSGNWMGKCMGYKISAIENPFENKAVDCLINGQ